MSNFEVDFIRGWNQQHYCLLMSGTRDVPIVDRQNPVSDFQFSLGSCSVGHYLGHKHSRLLHSKWMTGVIAPSHYTEPQRATSFDNCHYFNGKLRIYTTIPITYMIYKRTIGVYWVCCFTSVLWGIHHSFAVMRGLCVTFDTVWFYYHGWW